MVILADNFCQLFFISQQSFFIFISGVYHLLIMGYLFQSSPVLQTASRHLMP